MEKYYFTFGQNHSHAIGGITYDKDCVIEIEAESENVARDKMFETFGDRWSMAYNEKPDMSFFPRGIFIIN